MSFKNITTTLASAVATSGTFTVAYPTGTNSGSFYGGTKHKLFAMQTLYSAPADFTVAFGASVITVTWLKTITIPAGTAIALQADILGEGDKFDTDPGNALNISFVTPTLINLGAPVAASANGISVSAAIGAAGSAVLAASTLDVPRNIVGAWTTNSNVVVTGKDAYGNTVVESVTGAAAFTGKKAFKTITSITSSASITAATFGWGDVLGLPVWLPSTGLVIKELQDGAAPTAGTIVAGVTSTATATTGDTRGTYDPNAAADGSKSFALIAMLPNPSDLGVAQYAG
ncbi:MAG TPA: hypothetical protein VIU82_26035 [Bosea sp. (in: a-proteobacteria)]